MRFTFIFFLILICSDHVAQSIDNMTLFRKMNTNKYLRVCYENDFFTASDEYYTQGIQIEFANPVIGKFILSKALWLPGVNTDLYGIALQTEGYTPVYIDRSEIQFSDRPFSSAILFKTFSSGSDSAKKLHVSTSISIGIFGPGAGGKEIQTTIHKLIDYTTPLGWKNQISNDFALNYQVNVEKALLQNQSLLITADASARAGTYQNKLRTGFTVMAGKYGSPFSSFKSRYPSSWKYYIYTQPQLNLIGYDASLQGGIFNRSSPYVIGRRNISRITFQNRFGIVFSNRKWFFEYFQYFLTKEFATGHSHRSGGIQIAWQLK